MGKTVKSRLFFSITSIICVIALCIIANSSIPSLYESHAQKVAAQEAATRTTKQVVTVAPTTTVSPETTVTQESIVYEIEETTTPVVEDSVDEEVSEESTEADEQPAEESILDKILNFLTSIFDMIFSGEIFAKLGELFSGLLGIFGL